MIAVDDVKPKNIFKEVFWLNLKQLHPYILYRSYVVFVCIEPYDGIQNMCVRATKEAQPKALQTKNAAGSQKTHDGWLSAI